MHRAELPVTGRAEGLEDGTMEDVGADRDGGLEAEEEDEHRGHQRAAPHAGHADEEADQEPGHGELRIHRRNASACLLILCGISPIYARPLT